MGYTAADLNTDLRLLQAVSGPFFREFRTIRLYLVVLSHVILIYLVFVVVVVVNKAQVITLGGTVSTTPMPWAQGKNFLENVQVKWSIVVILVGDLFVKKCSLT